MISKIERGQARASIASLEALAGALGVPIVNLFSGTVDQTEASFTPAGGGVAVSRAGSTFADGCRLAGRVGDPDILFEPDLITIAERIGSRPLHSGHGMEFIHVPEDARRDRRDGQEFELTPADSLTFGATAPHGPVALIRAPVVFLPVVARRKD